MFDPSSLRVPAGAAFDCVNASTQPLSDASKKQLKKQLKALQNEFAELQQLLYADNRHSLLLVFQAMDAAGKDSTIRHVTTGVNPAGFQISSFKSPSKNELDHDFLWRSATKLPQRGRIGIFNRSYYEETLVVRVHPSYLKGQQLPNAVPDDAFWKQRFQSINEHEAHLSRNGTTVIKFWLNVSKQEQKNRLLARLDTPEKNWKFSAGDLDERDHWPQYMLAYQEALSATSTEQAPWYAIPADNKLWMRVQVARIIVSTLKGLPLKFPEATDQDQYPEYRARLQNERTND